MDGSSLWYFAYGSNMCSEQMAARCPGAGRPTTAVLDGYAWLCNDRGVATIAPTAGRRVHGVLWRVTGEHLTSLDRFEGVADGRYRRTTVEVTTGDGTVDAAVYIDDRTDPGPPRRGYLDRVLAGADEHGLPDDWRAHLARWRRAGPRLLSSDGGPQTLTELLATPGVTEHVELRSPFGFLALHGGALEEMTDEIARAAAAAAGASYYGVLHPAGHAHHLASTRYLPAESAALARFVEHVDVVVSIHGYGRRGQWRSILAGGRNRRLATRVAGALRTRVPGYDIVTDLDAIPRELRGMHPANPGNLPRDGGVQLELPPRVRGLSPLSPPPGADGLSPPTRGLIDGLADVARTWAG